MKHIKNKQHKVKKINTAKLLLFFAGMITILLLAFWGLSAILSHYYPYLHDNKYTPPEHFVFSRLIDLGISVLLTLVGLALCYYCYNLGVDTYHKKKVR